MTISELAKLDPATLLIVHHPADVLRQRAAPIAEISPAIKAIAARMIEIMRQEAGIGLAAPQVGLPIRMFIVDVPPTSTEPPARDSSDDTDDDNEDVDDDDTEDLEPEDIRSADTDPPTATRGLQVYINPVITRPSPGVIPFEEGCLSLPNIRGRVNRPDQVTITATNLRGEKFTSRAAGLLARCWQHEYDHLEGILIIDRMLQADRTKNRAKLKRLEQG